MKKFNTLEEAQSWIESVEKFGDKYDLIRMQNACKMLGNPEKSFKSVHIGGTNGKGSTLTFLKQILIESGYSVGTYTSPYIVRFNERITLNNVEIDDEALLKYINEIYVVQKDYLKEYGDQITFFELVTLISFLYFKDKKPDIVLVEVGLGGLLDATNVIMPILSIITTIGFDHMNVLGNTLESIARNKLGIVKEGIPLITGITQASLKDQFISHANEKNAPLVFVQDETLKDVLYAHPTRFVWHDTLFQMPMVGKHQVHNAHVALEAAHFMREHLNYAIDQVALTRGIFNAFWPGRFEVFGNIILDGAHNIEGLKACFDSVRDYFPDKRVKSLFTVMADKDYRPMLSELEVVADEVMFTQIPYPRCEKASVLFEASLHKHKNYQSDMIQALDESLPKNDDEVLVVTGSLYFISAIRKTILERDLK